MQARNLPNVIENDRLEIERQFTELERDDVPAEQRRQLTEHVIANLVRQFVAKEQFVFPLVRERLADGDQLAQNLLDAQTRGEHIMKELADSEVSDPRFAEKLTELIRVVREHADGEEKAAIRQLAANCSPAELADLGNKVVVTQDAAPTRPHPNAPDTPPVNIFVDAGAAMVDKIRDAVSGRRV